MPSAWQEFDCYKALDIARSASPAEIRRAYYVVSKRAHPDAGGSHEAQVRVNHAYAILSDPVSRQAHDIFWFGAQRAWAPGQPAVRRPWAPTTPTKPGEPEARRTRGLDAFVIRVQARVVEERKRIRDQQTERVQETVALYERRYYQGRT